MASLGNITWQHTHTDANKHRQRPQETDRRCLRKSGSVSLHLLVVGVCWHFMFPGDIWGVSGRSLWGVWRYLSGIHGNWRRLNKFGGVYEVSVLAVWTENTILAQSWMVWFFVNWPYWDIKIPKPPHIRFLKMIGLYHFLQFLGLPEKNYLWQSLWITLYQSHIYNEKITILELIKVFPNLVH